MKGLLRSVIDMDGGISQENLILNYQRLKSAGIEWTQPADQRIFDYVKGYFQLRLEIPARQTIADHFSANRDYECEERLKDYDGVVAYIRTNYAHLIAKIVEEQNKMKALQFLKEAQEIIAKGLVIGDEKKTGIRDGVLHFTAHAHQLLTHEHTSRLEGNIREDGQEVWDEYVEAKTNKALAWGKFTGLNEIDKVVKGIKRGEMWVHAAYTGELKCLPGDATVFDHQTGTRRCLSEMYESGCLPVVTALDREGATFRLLTATASHLVQNGVREVFDLTLTSGRKVGATGNHRFFTPSGWKELSALKEGDFVAVPRQMKVDERVSPFTDAEVKVIGYLLGDGSLKGHISFTASNDEIREDFMKCLVEMGLRNEFADYSTPSFHEEFPDDQAPYVLVSHSAGLGNSTMISPVRSLITSLGLWDLGAYHKHIPNVLFGLPESQIALLVGALWSTDGSCHAKDHGRCDRESPSRRNDITYGSVSEDLCLDLQSLLLRLGIQSSVTPVSTKYKGEHYTFYTLRVVTNHSKRRFVEMIRVVGKASKFETLGDRLLGAEGRVLPSEFLPDNRKVLMPQGYYRYSKLAKGRPTVTLEWARKFSESGDTLLKNAIEGDLDWEQVRSVVSRGMEMTYDLSVPNHHSFVVNDIVSHNTSFALNWAYNLVTRYRSSVFYVTLEMPYEQVRQMIFAMHTENPKFSQMGFKPLDYEKIKYGTLNPEEEAFFQLVIKDFCTNEEYGSFEVWGPDDDVTTDDIRIEAELKHHQSEIHLLVIDHGGLVEPRKKKRSKDYTIELNSIIRDTKKIALHFNHGEKIPVLLLFQINREGKDYADKMEGRYKLKALSYANECLLEGTLVRTDLGLIPIEEVPIGARVWSSTGWKSVLDNFNNGVRDLVTVELANGLFIEVTEDHLFRTLGPSGIGWEKASDLLGKYTLIDISGGTLTTATAPFLPDLVIEKFEKASGEQGTPLVTPKVMTEDLAYLMGCHDGDGQKLDDYRVGWTGNRLEVQVRDSIRSKFLACFGHPIALCQHPSRQGSFDLEKWSKPLHRWFDLVGMDRKPSVSPYVLRSSPSIQGQYLKGVWDADGSINNQGNLSLGMSSDKLNLIHQIQLIMLGLGVSCYVLQDTQELKGQSYSRHTIWVTSWAAKKRLLELTGGFTEQPKQDRLQKSLLVARRETQLWPVGEMYLHLFSTYRSMGMTRRCVVAARSVTKGDQLVPQRALEDLLSTLIPIQGDPILNLLRNLLANTLPVQVTSITARGSGPVYDLGVTGDHEYSTGGVFTHNCERSADIVTTTYLNDDHRKQGTTLFDCLKRRDGAHFEPFIARVNWPTRRIINHDTFHGSQCKGLTVEDSSSIQDMMFNLQV